MLGRPQPLHPSLHGSVDPSELQQAPLWNELDWCLPWSYDTTLTAWKLTRLSAAAPGDPYKPGSVFGIMNMIAFQLLGVGVRTACLCHPELHFQYSHSLVSIPQKIKQGAAEGLTSMQEAPVFYPQDTGVHPCRPSTQEMEAGGCRIQSHLPCIDSWRKPTQLSQFCAEGLSSRNSSSQASSQLAWVQ